MRHGTFLILLFVICALNPLAAQEELMIPDPELSNRYTRDFNEAIGTGDIESAMTAYRELVRVLPADMRIEYMYKIGQRLLDSGETESSTSVRNDAYRGAVEVFEDLQLRQRELVYNFYELYAGLRIQDLSDWPRDGVDEIERLWNVVLDMEEKAQIAGLVLNLELYDDFFAITVAAALGAKSVSDAALFEPYLIAVCGRLIEHATNAESVRWEETYRALEFDRGNIYSGLRYHLGERQARIALNDTNIDELEFIFRELLRPAADSTRTPKAEGEIRYTMFQYYYQPLFAERSRALEEIRLAYRADSTNFTYREAYAGFLHQRFIYHWTQGSNNPDDRKALYDTAHSLALEFTRLDWDWTDKFRHLLDAAQFHLMMHQNVRNPMTTEGMPRFIHAALHDINSAMPLLNPNLDAATRQRFWERCVRIYDAAFYDGLVRLNKALAARNFPRDAIPEEILSSIDSAVDTYLRVSTKQDTLNDNRQYLFKPQEIMQGSAGGIAGRKPPIDFAYELSRINRALDNGPLSFPVLEQLKTDVDVLRKQVEEFLEENPQSQDGAALLRQVEQTGDRIEQALSGMVLPPEFEQELSRINRVLDKKPLTLPVLEQLNEDLVALMAKLEAFIEKNPGNQDAVVLLQQCHETQKRIESGISDLRRQQEFERVMGPVRDWKSPASAAEAERFGEVFVGALSARDAGRYDREEVEQCFTRFSRLYRDWARELYKPHKDPQLVTTLIVPFYRSLQGAGRVEDFITVINDKTLTDLIRNSAKQ